MTGKRDISQFTARALRRYLLLGGLYLILIFVLPPSRLTLQQNHIVPSSYHLIFLAVALPSLLAWLAAFIGYAKFWQYAITIQKTGEGEHIQRIAIGVTWLAWSLPISALIGFVATNVASHVESLRPAAVIATNYINLIMPLIAFLIIGTAARQLMQALRLVLSLQVARLLMLLLLLLSVAFCYLTFRQFTMTSLSSTANPYFLPLWLVILTITVPYLYSWCVGLLAAFELLVISRHSPGVLYRHALSLLITGLLVVIMSLVAIQYINSVLPRAGHIVFDYKVVLISACRLVTAGGFWLLAIGADRLKRIEEV